MIPFKPQKTEEQIMKESEQRQMDFAKDQQNTQIGTSDDQTTLDIQSDRSDLLRWQQDLDDELQDLVYTLKSMYRNDDGKWVKKTFVKAGAVVEAKPLCNDNFINEVIIPQCKPFMSRNLINSNYNEQNILESLKNTMNDIADSMADHYDQYDINFINFDVITRHIKNVIKPGAFRALNGWTKKMDSSIIRRVESMNEGNPNELSKKKMFGLFGG